MGDGSIAASSDRINEHALFFQGSDDLGWGALLADYVKYHNVGFDVMRCDLNRRNLLKQPGEFFGMPVIVRQACDMVFQCVDAGGGKDARLAHGSSVHAAKAAGSVDNLPITRYQQGSHGRTEAL